MVSKGNFDISLFIKLNQCYQTQYFVSEFIYSNLNNRYPTNFSCYPNSAITPNQNNLIYPMYETKLALSNLLCA